MALLIPHGFSRDLRQNRAEVLLVLDGSDSNTALRAGQEASQILNQRVLALQRTRIGEALAAQGVAVESLLGEIRIEARAWYNPQLRTALFFVPGVLALVLMVVTMLLTAMGLTREKEIGTLEQIMVTPIRPIELMVGKTVPFAALGLLEVGFIVSIANLIFDVPMRGNVLALLLVAALFLMTTLGMGLFVSTISATQQQAMLTGFFVLLPLLMLSGYVFPIENMPEAVQWLTLVNPLRYYIELNRGLMIKGASLADLWLSVLALAALGAAVLFAAAARFQKRIA
jgi:ABC-2 type transport system permease protein